MTSSQQEQVIVVGGGLAGLSCAHTVLERGGRVLLLDKSPFLGGNSTKATSGINGANTNTQAEHEVRDTVKAFYEDTLKSARDLARPEMIKVSANRKDFFSFFFFFFFFFSSFFFFFFFLSLNSSI
jgi:succinate dehydrogenase/fumarate reductase flavoprotein subunit